MRRLQTATLSNQNITAYLLADTYTADADRAVMIGMHLEQVAGNGDYLAYITVQKGGAGSAYMAGPITTFTVPSGTTSIMFPSIIIPLESGDVAKCYVKGLAGDTTTPDILTRWFELTYLRPTTAGRTLDVGTTGEAGIDWANIGSPTTSQALTGTSLTLTSGERTTLAGVIWDTLLTAITTVGSIGKRIKDNLDVAVSTVAGVITVNASVAVSETVAASVATGEMAIQTYYPTRQTIHSTIVDDLSTASKLWLAIKRRQAANAGDDKSLIFVEQTDGLTIVDKEAYVTTADSTLTVTGSSGDWDIEFYLSQTVAALLADYVGDDLVFEIKAVVDTDPLYVSGGRCGISTGVVQAVA